ncbi:MnuA family membrane nuclease [Mycoplasmopsis citelli]|nr:hypothetical protein [Mycoplasmopsis citelli]
MKKSIIFKLISLISSSAIAVITSASCTTNPISHSEGDFAKSLSQALQNSKENFKVNITKVHNQNTLQKDKAIVNSNDKDNSNNVDLVSLSTKNSIQNNNYLKTQAFNKVVLNSRRRTARPRVQSAEGLKIVHWNILNYPNSKRNENQFKVSVISKVLSEINPDVIGLTEINNGKWDSVNLIVDKLNSMTNRHYEMVYQPESDYNSNSSEAVKESVVILYDTNKVSPLPFKDGSVKKSFKDYVEYPLEDEYDSTAYVRPPFGVMFKVNGTRKAFTTIFDHFDSPGRKEGEVSFADLNYTYPSNLRFTRKIGSQEGAEAFNLDKVFDYFKQNGAKNIVFGADTNIPANSSDIFVNLVTNGYLSGWEDQYSASTSLKSSKSIKDAVLDGEYDLAYAEPYDRMFYDGNNFVQDPQNRDWFKFDIFKNYMENSEFKNYVDSEYQRIFRKRLNTGENLDKNSNSIWFALRNNVSDHLPVWLSLRFKR